MRRAVPPDRAAFGLRARRDPDFFWHFFDKNCRYSLQ